MDACMLCVCYCRWHMKNWFSVREEPLNDSGCSCCCCRCAFCLYGFSSYLCMCIGPHCCAHTDTPGIRISAQAQVKQHANSSFVFSLFHLLLIFSFDFFLSLVATNNNVFFHSVNTNTFSKGAQHTCASDKSKMKRRKKNKFETESRLNSRCEWVTAIRFGHKNQHEMHGIQSVLGSDFKIVNRALLDSFHFQVLSLAENI